MYTYTVEIVERVREQFGKCMREKIKWISDGCWPSAIEGRIKEVDEFIGAARSFGVTTAERFTKKEIEALAIELSPFRTLDMKPEVLMILIDALRKKGVEAEVFIEPKDKK